MNSELENVVVVPELVQGISPICDFFEACPSPCRGTKWACAGKRTNEDRILMCAEYHRFLNGQHQKPESLRERDWTRILQRQIRVNREIGEKSRDKTRGKTWTERRR
jgi:hypothetical protein